MCRPKVTIIGLADESAWRRIHRTEFRARAFGLACQNKRVSPPALRTKAHRRHAAHGPPLVMNNSTSRQSRRLSQDSVGSARRQSSIGGSVRRPNSRSGIPMAASKVSFTIYLTTRVICADFGTRVRQTGLGRHNRPTTSWAATATTLRPSH